MRKFLSVTLYLLIISCLTFSQNANNKKENYVIVIHGGAGYLDTNMTFENKQLYLNGLKEALKSGEEILKKGGTSLDAVETAVKILEDNELFNAGKGAVFNSLGEVELDAAIMDGKDLKCGSVAAVKNIKNPISLARRIMEKTPHVLLTGPGAEKFAKDSKIDIVDSNYFKETSRYKEWHKKLKGTVGAVALDKYGNIAAATSTGGMTNKLPGRVGDAPIIGAGTYANNNTCGISCTGWGEKFIKNIIAARISLMIELNNNDLQGAINFVLQNILNKGDGGIIGIDKNGKYFLGFTTPSMLRGVATSEGIFEVSIW